MGPPGRKNTAGWRGVITWRLSEDVEAGVGGEGGAAIFRLDGVADLVVGGGEAGEGDLAGEGCGVDGLGFYRRAGVGVAELEDDVEDLLAGRGGGLVFTDDAVAAGDAALTAEVDQVGAGFAEDIGRLDVFRLGG